MNTLEVVAGLIVNALGEVLLAQRPPGKHLEGLWEFPGGKIEPGESPEQALARELREELGLEVEVVESLGRFTHVYEWGALGLHVFIVSPLNTPRVSADVQVFKWNLPGLIHEAELAPADVEPLRVYLNKAGPRAR